MVAEAEVVMCQQSVPIRYFARGAHPHNQILVHEEEDVVAASFDQVRASDSVAADLSSSESAVKLAEKILDPDVESDIIQYLPSIRSGSYADIGPRRHMEDEHIRIDDLCSHLGPLFNFPKPSAFFGVFDGHGGPEAAAYIRKNVIRLLFEDTDFPQTSEVDEIFLEELENSLHKSYLLADKALANDHTVSRSSGTTALTALVFGRTLIVANTGDCRAVLSHKGEAIDMSQDHRPIRLSERRRVEELGAYVDDGYLNGALSVTRALGDWDMKLPLDSPSPLIPDPECKQIILTKDDEFLIIACDGVWDVLSSQQAVNIVRRGLRRHDDPEQCARDLVMAALRLDTFDNLTVIVVCFSSLDHREEVSRERKLRCCSLSAEALCNLRSWLDK